MNILLLFDHLYYELGLCEGTLTDLEVSHSVWMAGGIDKEGASF